MILCLCTGTTDRDVQHAIDSGARCMTALLRHGAGTGCGACHPSLRDMLRRSGADESSLWCHLEHSDHARPAAIA